MAIAIPPKLMVLTLSPNWCNTNKETKSDNGMVTKEMMVVRTLAKNKNSTITTKSAPSRSESFTLSIELWIKRDWRNTSVDTWTFAGKSFCKSSIALSNTSVNSMVPVLGCLVTVSNTAGFPFSEATPNLGLSEPIFISATSDKVTG